MSFQTLEAVATRHDTARVDLLPPEIGQARALRKLQVGLGCGVVAVAVAAAAAALVTQGHVDAAQDALAAERARTPALQQEQAEYAEVPAVLAEVALVESARDQAQAHDVKLYSLMDQVAATAPADLSLTTLTFTVTAGEAGTAAATAGVATSDSPGTVDVVGVTKSESQVASFMESLDALDGIDGTTLASTARDESGVITFTLSGALTPAALAHGS
ncbi:PilN domain-containing protein [Kineococcus sp. TBRC 1896]|uniref:PilN domain-containing protein n=1 Tax=Kineococcus mangrovi TaxID=1660183 RepID=A0ABV4I6Q2_9ACTN